MSLRMSQEYFQSEINRKTRIFSLVQKNNILIEKKECKYLTVNIQQLDRTSFRYEALFVYTHVTYI